MINHQSILLFDDRGMLRPTHGCVRVYNGDMLRLVSWYKYLRRQGKTIKCYVEEVPPERMGTVFATYGTMPDPKDKPRPK